MSKFQELIVQIEYFIKKYYKNEMVKGALLFLIIFLVSFLTVSTLEYFGRFSPMVRTILFWSFVISNGFVAIKYVIIPLLKLSKIGDRLSVSEASEMIGRLFPEVSDKLQNTLQLSNQLSNDSGNIELIKASIQQKSMSLSAIPFSRGIELGENRKYLKFLLPIVVIFSVLLIVKPNLLGDGSNRIINYSTEFIEEAPFDFVLLSTDSVMQGEDYRLLIKLSGNDIPPGVKIKANNGSYNLKKESAVEFSYTFRNLDKDLIFQCEANGFKSESFRVVVLQKPALTNVEIKVNYPKHTGMADETFSDLSDLTVPEGSSLEWDIRSENTSFIEAEFDDTTIRQNGNLNSEFKFNKTILQSQVYRLMLSTNQVVNADTIENRITTIADSYPEINVLESKDSLLPFNRFINGNINDDYGFSALFFIAKIQRKDSIETVKTRLKINTKQTDQMFQYQFDLKSFNLKPGNELSYFFIVSDNDAPNGYKSVSSNKIIYKVPELSELDNDLAEKSDKLKEEMDKTLKDAQEMKQQIEKLKNTLINKSTPDWKDKQTINNILNQQEKLQMDLEKMKQQFDRNAQEENEFSENSEELKEKQELLEKLMNELLDDEMKALLEELQKMMDDMNKEEILENMEKMEQKSSDLEKELDRTLELFKHLELDKKMEGIEEQLRVLAEEQEALKEETKSKSLDPDALQKKQEKLNEKFDEIQKDILDAKEMNEQLEQPKKIDFDKELENAIEEEMNKAKDKLGDGKEKKASENQEKASEMMKQMADDVQAMMDSASGQQDSEDMEKLRFLLENIVNLSFQQEALMNQYEVVDRNNPLIVGLNREQLKIGQSTEIVKDSLLSLAKRHAQLSNTIITELNDLSYNQDKAKDYGQERNLSKVKQHQQYAVTSYNDLALLLSEVLEQMQSAMQSQKPGSGSCDKPGGSGQGSPKSGQMSMQQMKDQLKKQMEQMKNGSKPGGKEGKKPGEGEGAGQQGLGNGSIPGLSAKEIAKMALEQSQMRQALQQLRQELNKDGSGSGNGLNQLINDMEKLENDLLNNGFTNDIMRRHQDIMTRLLESEKALLERGYSEEREAKEGKNGEVGNQKEILEYNKKKESEIELLRTVPVGLRVYYKNKINTYFNTVNE
ncbi:MAG: hypothetical protein R3279_00820 [Putridiphycobacter sp.]|nr:hypothetical protein [Putridiphycobacter sp.]